MVFMMIELVKIVNPVYIIVHSVMEQLLILVQVVKEITEKIWEDPVHVKTNIMITQSM